MSRWADAFRALTRSVDTADSDGTAEDGMFQPQSVTRVSSVIATNGPEEGTGSSTSPPEPADTADTADTLDGRNVPPILSVSRVSSVRPIGSLDGDGTHRLRDPMRSADTADSADTRGTDPPHGRPRSVDTADSADTSRLERYGDCSVTSVSCVTAIGASGSLSTIDLLAAKLLSQAERNPAIRITDRAKALDYFRARAAAGGVESKSAAKPPQPDRPSALRKVPMVAEIISPWSGARFVQFIDE